MANDIQNQIEQARGQIQSARAQVQSALGSSAFGESATRQFGGLQGLQQRGAQMAQIKQYSQNISAQEAQQEKNIASVAPEYGRPEYVEAAYKEAVGKVQPQIQSAEQRISELKSSIENRSSSGYQDYSGMDVKSANQARQSIAENNMRDQIQIDRLQALKDSLKSSISGDKMSVIKNVLSGEAQATAESQYQRQAAIGDRQMDFRAQPVLTSQQQINQLIKDNPTLKAGEIADIAIAAGLMNKGAGYRPQLDIQVSPSGSISYRKMIEPTPLSVEPMKILSAKSSDQVVGATPADMANMITDYGLKSEISKEAINPLTNKPYGTLTITKEPTIKTSGLLETAQYKLGKLAGKEEYASLTGKSDSKTSLLSGLAGVASVGVGALILGKGLITKPIQTSQAITGSIKGGFTKAFITGEGFPEVSSAILTKPTNVVGQIAGNIFLAKSGPIITRPISKGFDIIGTKLGYFKPVVDIGGKKVILDIPSSTPGKTLNIPLQETLPKLPLTIQAKIAGTTQNLVSGARDLFGIFKKEINIDKPVGDLTKASKITLNMLDEFKAGKLIDSQIAELNQRLIKEGVGKGLLEKAFFADPFGRIRPSRLGLKGDITTDIYSPALAKLPSSFIKKWAARSGEEYTLFKKAPQIISIEKQSIANFPKSLSDVASSLKKGISLTTSQEERLLKWQLEAGTGQFKPIGFTSREAEVTLAPGELLKTTTKLPLLTRIKGESISIFKAIPGEASTKVKTLINKVEKGTATATEELKARKLLSKETGLDYYFKGPQIERNIESPYISSLSYFNKAPKIISKYSTLVESKPIESLSVLLSPKSPPKSPKSPISPQPSGGISTIPSSSIIPISPITPPISPPISIPISPPIVPRYVGSPYTGSPYIPRGIYYPPYPPIITPKIVPIIKYNPSEDKFKKQVVGKKKEKLYYAETGSRGKFNRVSGLVPLAQAELIGKKTAYSFLGRSVRVREAYTGKIAPISADKFFRPSKRNVGVIIQRNPLATRKEVVLIQEARRAKTKPKIIGLTKKSRGKKITW